MSLGPLWTCPDCGRSFANKNQWHACQTTSVEEHLADKTDLAVSIYQAVVATLEKAGKFRIHPQKTRIAFISRMTFGGVTLARNWADLTFILPEPLDNDRIRRLELYGPTSWGHTMRLFLPDDVDDLVAGWLSEALRRGDQETLDPSAEVSPLTGAQLTIFWTGFRGRVETAGDELVVRLPGHIAEALALVDDVVAKVGGVEYGSELARGEEGTSVPVDPTSGLGDGDETDVFLKVGE